MSEFEWISEFKNQILSLIQESKTGISLDL